MNSENLIIILGPIFMLSIKNGNFVALILFCEIYGMWMEKVKEIVYIDRKPLVEYYKYLDVLYLFIYVYQVANKGKVMKWIIRCVFWV